MDSTPAFSHEPSPGHPGWHSWQLSDPDRFNARTIGTLLIRPEGGQSARVRLPLVEKRHANLHDNVHGGLTMALIDVAMFATVRTVLGPAADGAVTLDLHNQFIGAGRLGEPLDAVCEIVRETGRMIFLRGRVEQGEHLVASFIGTLRKSTRR